MGAGDEKIFELGFLLFIILILIPWSFIYVEISGFGVKKFLLRKVLSWIKKSCQVIYPQHLSERWMVSQRQLQKSQRQLQAIGKVVLIHILSCKIFSKYKFIYFCKDWEDIGVLDRDGWHGENLGPLGETRSTGTPKNTDELYWFTNWISKLCQDDPCDNKWYKTDE